MITPKSTTRGLAGTAKILLLALVPCLAGGPGAWAGPALIKEKGCDACHRFSPRDAATPESARGPDLFYAGNKFREKWLVEFLHKPAVVRKAGYITDPGFLEGKPEAPPHVAAPLDEAKTLAGYLTTLKLPGIEEPAGDIDPLSKGNRAKVKILFERNYGCSACHETINLAGKIHGGVSGPSLVDAGNRLTAGWVSRWLKDPKLFLEKGRMPAFKLDDETAAQLVKYILSMKKENLK
ncbi:MAG: cytochrome c [Nitrospinae bacterium]|nr:cytochrome c [Nitrospinota bacterium]